MLALVDDDDDGTVVHVHGILHIHGDHMEEEELARRLRGALRGRAPDAPLFGPAREPLLCALARAGYVRPRCGARLRAVFPTLDPTAANAAGETPLCLALCWLARRQRFQCAADAARRQCDAARALLLPLPRPTDDDDDDDDDDDAHRLFDASTCARFARWCLPSLLWRPWLIEGLLGGVLQRAEVPPALRRALTGPLLGRLARLAGPHDATAAADALALLSQHGHSALDADDLDGVPACERPTDHAALAELLHADAVAPASPDEALAFAMGLHPRLGADSPLRRLAGVADDLLRDLILARVRRDADPVAARTARLAAFVAAEPLVAPLDRHERHCYLACGVRFDPAAFRRAAVARLARIAAPASDLPLLTPTNALRRLRLLPTVAQTALFDAPLTRARATEALALLLPAPP